MLEFHPVTIILTIVNLLILYAFFRKFLFGRVNAVMEERKAMIEKDLSEAEAENDRARQLQAAYEAKLSGADQEAAHPDDELMHDHFHMVHPDTDWESCVAHAEKIGLGARSYELVEVK